jgi:RNA polymerase sigma factor (sigma-70 family)
LAALIHAEDCEHLQEALGCLSDRQSQAIRLRFFDGLTFEEVGAAMGISKQGAVHVVKSALETLKARMI